MARMKLLHQKSYSAPYIMLLDCFEDPLRDTETEFLHRAYSTSMLQNLELKEEGEDEEEDFANEDDKWAKEAHS